MRESARRGDKRIIAALGLVALLAMLALAATGPSSVATISHFHEPDLLVKDTSVKGREYVFSGKAVTLSWKATVKNAGDEKSKRSKAGLVLQPVGTDRQQEVFTLHADKRKVPALKPGATHRVAGSKTIQADGTLPLGRYRRLVCVYQVAADAENLNRCNHEGDLYVAQKTWTGELSGQGGGKGAAGLEHWDNLGEARLNFESYRHNGVFNYTYSGAVSWVDHGTNNGGCTWDGQGQGVFDASDSGPGILLKYKARQYVGVVGANEGGFYTLTASGGGGFSCAGQTSPGPIYPDFLNISKGEQLGFDQIVLTGHSVGGVGGPEDPSWDWTFR